MQFPMRAMVLDAAQTPLRLDGQMDIPQPSLREVLIRVHACGVCRTDLHVMEAIRLTQCCPWCLGMESSGRLFRR